MTMGANSKPVNLLMLHSWQSPTWGTGMNCEAGSRAAGAGGRTSQRHRAAVKPAFGPGKPNPPAHTAGFGVELN